MSGDPGDSALGGYEGEIRGPNDLASGGLDGLGAGLGNIVPWRAEASARTSRRRRRGSGSRASEAAPTPPISARGATALPGRWIWKLVAAPDPGIGDEIGSEAKREERRYLYQSTE